MPFFTKSILEETIYEAKLFSESATIKKISDTDVFDVFLSHSYKDKKYIRKLKQIIETAIGLRCYVDWITEPTVLDRNNISKNSADILRKRMRQSSSLIFCTSDNSPDSKWMPWELGYFDAYRGRVAILPILDEGKSFQGQEYLGLYPYIDKNDTIMWVNFGGGSYLNFKEWLSGREPDKK